MFVIYKAILEVLFNCHRQHEGKDNDMVII